eukprot:Phypoly_transcript_11703.p1 GENE.Phypoly_transcript_11703~~Phypoly_transcript_11703.p1  ORF type:complete len:338 (+),score=16.05 Phypoly_transcript_11703:116-1129(+)
MPLLASLSLPSLTPDVRKALASINVKSVEDLLFGEQGTIAFRSGINQEVVSALVLELQKHFTATPKQGSNIYWDYVNNACIVPTGSNGLDSILDGGLWGGEMTELVGQPATGKTQICMLAALTTVKQSKTVVYIDSANSFSPERIVEMHTSSETASQETSTQAKIAGLLNRISCRKCFDAFTLIEILHDLQSKLATKEVPFYSALKLVVIDSIGGLLSPIIGKQQQGHSLMTNISRLIKDMAMEYHIAFLVTNYVVSGGDADRATFKPALGMSWSYAPNTQITLYHDLTNSSRRATLTKSSHSVYSITFHAFHLTSLQARDRAVLFQIDAQGINSAG